MAGHHRGHPAIPPARAHGRDRLRGSGAFWMRDTPLPLRITFVAASGSVVSASDMVPCLPPTPSGDCERYHPDGPYRIAIEHPLGIAFDIGLAAAEFVEVTVE